MIKRGLIAIEQRNRLNRAIRRFPVGIASTLTVCLASAVARTLVHELATVSNNRAVTVNFVALQASIVDVVSEELVACPVVVVWYKVARFGNRQVVEIV